MCALLGNRIIETRLSISIEGRPPASKIHNSLRLFLGSRRDEAIYCIFHGWIVDSWAYRARESALDRLLFVHNRSVDQFYSLSYLLFISGFASRNEVQLISVIRWLSGYSLLIRSEFSEALFY